MAKKAILFDVTKCMGCRACQVACKQWWELPAVSTRNRGSYENPPDLSHHTWVTIRFNEVVTQDKVAWLFSRRSCMHCTDAACVEVCPTDALTYHPSGFVAYDENQCTGCGYCVKFCPFNVPRLSGSSLTGLEKMGKCLGCIDRVSNGQVPACVKTCPPEALMFGDRDQMVEIGRQRVHTLKAAYPNAYLYGESKEVGGTHVLYVLDDSPQKYGLPQNPQVPASVLAWQGILQPVGYLAVAAALVGVGLNYLVARKNIKRESDEEAT